MAAYQWGAVTYILWGVMHVLIGAQILILNLGASPRAVVTTLYQDPVPSATPTQLGPVIAALMNQHAWNLLWFGLFAAIVGAVWNWRNSAAGYWANLSVVSLADIGFIAAILLPGYIDPWLGLWGPVLWIVAVGLTTRGRISARQLCRTDDHVRVP